MGNSNKHGKSEAGYLLELVSEMQPIKRFRSAKVKDDLANEPAGMSCTELHLSPRIRAKSDGFAQEIKLQAGLIT